MERLKSITIIFLLAVGLLSSAAPAKPAGVLLQEGLYAEEIEGDLDAAIKIYGQVITQAKDAQQAAAQAMYRIGICYLKKGEKTNAAEYFQQIVSNYQSHKALVEKATQQLRKIAPQHGEQLPWEVMVYIYDKHMDAHKKAKSMGIAVNSHIVGVDEEFIKYPGGILTHETSNKVAAGSEIWLGNFSKAGEVDFFNEELKPQEIRFSKRETDAIGKYMLLWKADRDMEAGEVRVIAYRSKKTDKLIATDNGYRVQFNNHYGSPVLENFFLVVPLNVSIIEQSREYVSRKKFDVCEIYLWQREVPANTTNKVDVVLARSEILIQDYAESVPVEQLIKSGKVPAFKTQIYDNTGLDLETGVTVAFMDEWPMLCDVAWDNDGGGALMKNPESSVRFLALGAAEKWEDAISMARSILDVLRTSNARGMFASQSKFVAVLTNEGNLAVVQIGRHDQEKAAISWWLEKLPAYSFGTTYTVVLYDIDHPTTKGKPSAIDLATNRILTIPRQQQMSGADMMNWVRRRGVDALAEIAGKERGLIGVDLAVEMLASDEWDTVTPQKLQALLAPTRAPRQDTKMMLFEDAPPQPIFAFKTREGIYGVLQITDVNELTQKVQFRYKMVQDVPAGIKAKDQELQKRGESARKLKQLGLAVAMCADEHDSKLPDTLQELGPYVTRMLEPYVGKKQDFQWILDNVAYLGKGKKARTPPDAVIAYDRTLLKKGNGTNVLFGDSHVEFVVPERLEELGITPKTAGATLDSIRR